MSENEVCVKVNLKPNYFRLIITFDIFLFLKITEEVKYFLLSHSVRFLNFQGNVSLLLLLLL